MPRRKPREYTPEDLPVTLHRGSGNMGHPKPRTREKTGVLETRPVKKLAYMVPIDNSSAIKAIGFLKSRYKGIKKREGVLGSIDVEFSTGAIYRFHGLPEEVFERALEAESKGSYVTKVIRAMATSVRRLQ